MMHSFHILGLFPEVLYSYFNSSLIGKSRENKLIEFFYHNLRDYSKNSYNAVDDKPYGGGAGMVMTPDVVCDAVRDLKNKNAIKKVVLTSATGDLLTPQIARDLSQVESCLFLCGRFEGLDQRAIDLVVDEELSIGDYVVTGGEIATGVIVDTVCRYIPGVIGKADSVEQDSHENGLLEHPHYTRPESFESIPVPSVLLSGDHKKIEAWRRQESLRKTWLKRPDLLKRAELNKEDLEYLQQLIQDGK